MKIDLEYVEALMNQAINKCRCTDDAFGYGVLTKAVNEHNLNSDFKTLGDRYISETIVFLIRKAKRLESEYINIKPDSLDAIASYLGFKSLKDFTNDLNPNLTPGQLAIAGNWLSYVRCNSGDPRILVSPVQISIEKNNRATLTLQGPSRKYAGRIHWVAGSMSCHMTSEDNAKFYHLAFHVGVVKDPMVLQGVFSGISTSGLPIAGKEILVRNDSLFDDVTPFDIDMENPTNDVPFEIPKSILDYFKEYYSCYLKVNNSSTFNFKDLKVN